MVAEDGLYRSLQHRPLAARPGKEITCGHRSARHCEVSGGAPCRRRVQPNGKHRSRDSLRQIMRRSGAWARIQADITELCPKDKMRAARSLPSKRPCFYSNAGDPFPAPYCPSLVIGSRNRRAVQHDSHTRNGATSTLQDRSLKFGKDKTASGTGRNDPPESAGRRNLEVLGRAIPHPATGAFRLSIGAVRSPRNRRDFRRDCPGLRLRP